MSQLYPGSHIIYCGESSLPRGRERTPLPSGADRQCRRHGTRRTCCAALRERVRHHRSKWATEPGVWVRGVGTVRQVTREGAMSLPPSADTTVLKRICQLSLLCTVVARATGLRVPVHAHTRRARAAHHVRRQPRVRDGTAHQACCHNPLRSGTSLTPFGKTLGGAPTRGSELTWDDFKSCKKTMFLSLVLHNP